MVRSPTPFGLGRNSCWPSRGSQYPRHSPSFFHYAAPKRPQQGSTQLLQNRSPVFFSLAFLRLLILLFLMSGNVHPNPGPIFPCSVCAGNVTWRGKSVQCCTCSKWVHLRCSQLSLSKFRALGSSQSWSFPSCRNTVTLSLDSSDMYTSTVQSAPPPLLLMHSRPTLVFKPLIAHLPILYLLPLPLHHRPLHSWLSFYASSAPLTLSGFFNRMLEVFEPGARNYFTFFRPSLSTLSASRNPILTHLLFQDSLLCVLIAPTPGLAFSLVMPHTLAAVSSFSLGRAYSLSFLPPLFLRLIPTLIMRGQHLS